MSKLLQTIELVSKRLNPKLRVSGVVLCMFEGRTSLAKEVASDVGEFLKVEHGNTSPWAGAIVFNTKIRRNIRLAEAPSFGRSIFDYDAKSNGAEDYGALADEIVKMTENQ